MKILLTGVNGQVGYELQTTLAGLGEIIALDRAQLDLTNTEAIRAVVARERPDLIINPAAYTAVDKAESESALAHAINVEAPRAFAQSAQQIGAGLIHYSTDYVYPGDGDQPYLEADVTGPLSVYGQSKLAGEEAIRESGVAHLILRTSWVYGLRGKNFLLTMLRLANERPELKVVADQFGAPTWSRMIALHTAQIVAQLQTRARTQKIGLAQALASQQGTYHFCAAGTTSWHGFTQAIVELAHAQGLLKQAPRVLPITTADYPTPARRPANSRMNLTQLQNTYAITPLDWKASLVMCLRELTP